MKKIISVLISLCLISLLFVPALALEVAGEKHVLLYHVEGNWQTITVCKSVEAAVSYAKDGDTVEVFDSVDLTSQIVIPENITLTIVSGTKNDTLVNSNTSDFHKHGEDTYIKVDENAEPKTVTATFDGSAIVVSKGATLNLKNITLSGKESNTEENGGLIYVSRGATLNTEGGVTLQNSTLAGESAKGGAIFAKAGATVSIAGTTFTGNTAAEGGDIYAEDQKNLTVAEGIVADIAYGEGAQIETGDLNEDYEADEADALYLLYNLYFPKLYPLNQECDFNGDGTVNDQDAIHLLFHYYFPEIYKI